MKRYKTTCVHDFLMPFKIFPLNAQSNQIISQLTYKKKKTNTELLSLFQPEESHDLSLTTYCIVNYQKLLGRFNHNIQLWKRLHFCINSGSVSVLRSIGSVRLYINYPFRYEIKIMNYSPICTPILMPFAYYSSSRCSITFLSSLIFPKTHYRPQLSIH